jgi:hypothetical protein
MYATYRREYENFTHLLGESIDALFQRFTVVVNNMRTTVDVLLYDDHDGAPDEVVREAAREPSEHEEEHENVLPVLKDRMATREGGD